ncbi:MAG: hypothetical protein BroJett040_23700 [Oligoflexia bacterium]|nr:MAG: hypothetical protein BroJett040_23700 [Oligoflexia bacterium]
MKRMTHSLFGLCLATGLTAYAGPKQDQTQQKLGFEEIREACLNPAKYHNQVAPTDIQIACRDLQIKWVADSDGSMKMPNGRHMTGTIISDKYTSDAVTAVLVSADQVATCPRFKQVAETLESVYAVTCQELVSFTGSLMDFCAAKTNSLRAANPKAIKVEATGQVVDYCRADVGQKSPGDQNQDGKQDGRQDQDQGDQGQDQDQGRSGQNGPNNGRYGPRNPLDARGR